jgi:hypothetical protein
MTHVPWKGLSASDIPGNNSKNDHKKGFTFLKTPTFIGEWSNTRAAYGLAF